MRVSPTPRLALLAWAMYVAIVLLVQRLSGIPYTDFGDSASTLWRGAIVSLVIGSLAVGVLAARLGWWEAALCDRHRSPARWTLAAPILYTLMALGTLAATDWQNIDAAYLVAAVALGVSVGFAEEFVCRGVLVVGLRGRLREVWVWMLSCLFFGLMHGINILLGAAVGDTVGQIISAAVQGSALYLLRRVTGTLLWAMALHGFWDFAVFVDAGSGGGVPLTGLLIIVAGPLGIVGGLVVALQTDRGRQESYSAGAAARV